MSEGTIDHLFIFYGPVNPRRQGYGFVIHDKNFHDPVTMNLRFPPVIRICLFCKSRDRNCFKGEEHVFPESIGNKRFILPPGVVCDKCNRHFSYLENSFIHSSPMFFWRCFSPELTKKNKWPKTPLPDGFIEGSRKPHDPIPTIELRDKSLDRKEYSRFKAELHSNTLEYTFPSIRLPKEKIQVTSRVLAKIALELAYLRFPCFAFDQACNGIRRFARCAARHEYLPYAWNIYLGEPFEFWFIEEVSALGISVSMAVYFTMPGAQYLVSLTPLGVSSLLSICAEKIGLKIRTREDQPEDNFLRLKFKRPFNHWKIRLEKML